MLTKQLKISTILSIVFLLSGMMSLLAQNSEKDYSLLFKSGTEQPEKGVKFLKHSSKQISFDGKQYLIIQFYETPDIDKHHLLQSHGVELLEYIPNYAYWASFPQELTEDVLQSLGVKSTIYPSTANKMSPELYQQKFPDYAVNKAGTVDVFMTTFKNIEPDIFKKELEQRSTEILEKVELSAHTLKVRVSQEKLPKLARLPFVKYIESIPPPEVPLGGSRASSVRAEYINHPMNGGLTGDNVFVNLIDSGTPKHIDLINQVIDTGVYSYEFWHSSACASAMAGRGILNPSYNGVAPNISLWVQASVQDMELIDSFDIRSLVLGGGPGSPYNTSSSLLDTYLLENTKQSYVCSAGNSGAEDNYTSIVSSHQQAKNSLTVGAIGNYNQPWSNTSKGPTMDGRLKPEIVAVGTDIYLAHVNNTYHPFSYNGTSFSGPQVAGGLALLYEHYRNLNNGEDPKAALMKAIVCNSADDLGNEGPDYIHGYGKLNLRRAKAIIDNEHHLSSEISADGQEDISIEVPENTHQLKVMLYWADAPGSSSAEQVLVNDLRLIVDTPNGTSHDPYILDPLDPTALATTGIDNINNIEQVVIENPSPGLYTAEISGETINIGTHQKFHVVYEVIEKGLTLITPMDGELVKGNGPNYYIEWDYDGTDDNTFSIDYSVDNGQTWNSLKNNIAADVRIYQWQPHFLTNLNTSEALVRVSKNNTSYSDQNDTPFKIYNMVKSKEVEFTSVCDNVVKVEWLAVSGAVAYEVMMYNGVDDMEVVGYTTSTSKSLPFDFSLPEGWFAVRAVYPNGARSMRSNAQRFIPESGNNDCPIGETGQVSNIQTDKDTWFTVNLELTYINPVVIMGPPGYFGNAPTTVRVKDVTSNSFKYQLDEWDYLDGAHAEETISYMVVEAGTYTLENDAVLIAGNTSGTNHNWFTQDFGFDFPSKPIVLSQTITRNGASAVTTRQRNVSTNQFQVKLQEQQSQGSHAAETVSWVAIGRGQGTDFEANITGNVMTHNWRNRNFNQDYSVNPVFLANLQTTNGNDPASLRYDNLNSSSVEIMVQEEQSADNEIGHTAEVMGYYAAESGFVQGVSFSPKIEATIGNSITLKNYPNPFAEQTTIGFTLSTDLPVTLSVFDSMGRNIATLLDAEPTTIGTHQVTFSGADYSSGVYYYTIQAGEFFGTQKMTLVK